MFTLAFLTMHLLQFKIEVLATVLSYLNSWLATPPPLPAMDMLRILFYMYHVCTKTVPDFTKLHLIKGPKSKFSQGSIPWTP